MSGIEPDKKTTDSFYDSFRWLEEDKELDLKLYLDDYHANLRQDLPPATESRRPSFRRTMSITKLPFGRTSVSSTRPGTTQASSPVLPRYTPSSPTTTLPAYTGRRSRALSWMSSSRQNQLVNSVPFTSSTTKHSACQSVSPRAIETAGNAENIRPNYELEASVISRSDQTVSTGEDKLHTFLADDKSSIYSDEGSVADPQSPVTPQGMEKASLRPLRRDEPAFTTSPATDPAGAPSSREITVRMTLTRPDLRAKDEELYGWQARKRQTLLEDYDPITCAREGNSKESIERQLAAMDQWHAQVQERGKMKRLWHKVRRT